jgi:hypothetical protein
MAVFREAAVWVVGCFDGEGSDPPLEKQIPRARKKALGTTRSKQTAAPVCGLWLDGIGVNRCLAPFRETVKT